MAKSDTPSQVVVCDAGPIIHLDEIGSLNLLSDFLEIIVPETVWEEVERHRPAALTSTKLTFQRRKPEAPSIELAALTRLFALHRGESEALQIAETRPGCILLTDDAAARLAAKSRKLQVHGTIGILVRAIRRRQMKKSEVLERLRSIPRESTLHIQRNQLLASAAAEKLSALMTVEHLRERARRAKKEEYELAATQRQPEQSGIPARYRGCCKSYMTHDRKQGTKGGKRSRNSPISDGCGQEGRGEGRNFGHRCLGTSASLLRERLFP